MYTMRLYHLLLMIYRRATHCARVRMYYYMFSKREYKCWACARVENIELLE